MSSRSFKPLIHADEFAVFHHAPSDLRNTTDCQALSLCYLPRSYSGLLSGERHNLGLAGLKWFAYPFRFIGRRKPEERHGCGRVSTFDLAQHPAYLVGLSESRFKFFESGLQLLHDFGKLCPTNLIESNFCRAYSRFSRFRHNYTVASNESTQARLTIQASNQGASCVRFGSETVTKGSVQ